MANATLNASANAQAEVIINLTPHLATPDQASAGLIDMPEDGGLRAALTEALSFNHQPDQEELLRRARRVVGIMADYAGGMTALQGRKVMLGGFSALMHPLQAACLKAGMQVGYAYPGLCECVDQLQPDGSVLKMAIFRHGGFIWVS